jgi:tetratricopeptide (TPR) repeat protein
VAFCTVIGLAGLLTIAGPALLPASAVAPAPPLEDLTRRATAAREAGRLAEAARLYREALSRDPQWAEGWWFLGSLAYEEDRFPECQDAFEHLIGIDPEIGPAWGLRGLCAFALGEYTVARRDVERALEVGPVADEPLWRVVLYHRALLLIRDGQFERAIPPLRQLAAIPNPGPELEAACGLQLLRRATLPGDVADADRDLVRLAGRAQCATLAERREEAEQAFRELLARYPRERHVHYGHGILLAQAGSAEAIDAFQGELALHPDHVLARVELAFNLLTHGRNEEAVGAAEAAVRQAPELFAAHLALGRARVATGELALGIFELESAARLAPGSPEVFYALSRAYAQAGRRDEGERANARFLELDGARRSGAESE